MTTPITTKLVATRSYPQIGTIGQAPAAQAQNLLAINNILQLGLRNTGDISDSFVRVSDLVALDFITLTGNLAIAKVSGTSLAFANSLVDTAGVVSLVGDVLAPTASQYYGTNGSSVHGWYNLPSGAVGANPTATVGPAATNGTAATFMRSDAAPALANTTVTAGAYTSADITVDAQGRLTAAASGGGSSMTQPQVLARVSMRF